MSESKHTRGPWRHTGAGIIDNWPDDRRYVGGDIADVYGADRRDERGPTTAEANANARLISAAPDLLAACSAIVADSDKGEPRFPEDYGASFASIKISLIGAARAAIAKATGKDR